MRITATIALCLLAFASWGQSSTQVRILDTMADLMARKPVAGETVQVRNRTASILWSAPRSFTAYSTSAITNAHDGTHYVTNARPNSIYVSHDRFADQQDVRWFGANPDDETDDTTAVQAAVNYSGGKYEVFLSPSQVAPGKYLLNAVLASEGGTRIAGSSPGTTTLDFPTAIKPSGTNFALIIGNDLGGYNDRMHGFTVKNLSFIGEHTAANGLWINGGAYWGVIDNCSFMQFTGIGTLVGGNTNSPVSLVEFQNCKWQNTDNDSTASLYVKQSSEYPTGFVTAINLHSCHLDEAGANAGSFTMIVDSVAVTTSGGTYFDLGNGGQGLRFDRSESPFPTMSGSFVLDANSSGRVAEETYGAATPRVGLLFPSGDYLIDGVVYVGGEEVEHSGRGWGNYQTLFDYPYVLGALAIQDTTASGSYEWNQDHRLYVNATDFVWNSVSRNLYALASAGSVVARTLGNSNTIFSLDVQSTPTPTNAALRVGGGSGLYSYVTGQGYIGVGYANPVASVAVNGGLNVGANSDPGTGVASASVGFVVPARGSLTPSSTSPIRSVNHTYTDLASTAIAHQLSAEANLTANQMGTLYNTYFTTRTGSGTNVIGALYGVQTDLTIDEPVIVGRGLAAQVNYTGSLDSGSLFGMRVNAPSYSGSGRPTNLFGLYIDTQSGARSANWGLYVVGGESYFGSGVTVASGQGITLGGVTQTNWPSGGTVAWGDITGKPAFGDLALEDWPASDGQEYVAKNGAWAVATGGVGGTSVFVEGTSVTNPNFYESSEIQWDVSSVTNVTPSIKSASIATNKIDATFYGLLTEADTVVSTNITDSTAAGRALLTAVDAAAQRTALSLGTSALLSVATSGNAASGEVVKGDDTRLTDARTPTSHSHDAGAITSGVLALARIGTGTPHGSNFLRGDGQFAQVTTNDIPGLVAALAAGGGGGSAGTKTLASFRAQQGEPPASNYPTFSTRNAIGTLLFDHTTEEDIRFRWVVPEGVTNTVVDVVLKWTTTATSGDGRWGARNMRLTGDIDSDSFDTAVEAATTTSATAGTVMTTTLEDVSLDGAVAGDWVWLEVYRDASDGADTINSNDLELHAVEVRAP